VANPKGSLIELCDFLEEPFEPQMVKFNEYNKQEKLEPDRHMGWKYLTREPVKTERIAAWKKEFDSESLLRVNTISKELLNRYNYKYNPQQKNALFLKVKKLFYNLSHDIKCMIRPFKQRLIY